MEVNFYYDYAEIDGLKYGYDTDTVKKLYDDAGREAAAIKHILPIVENVLKVSEELGKRRQYVDGILAVMAALQAAYRQDLRAQDEIFKYYHKK